MIKLFDILKAEKTGLSNSVYTSLLAKKLSGGSAPTVKELEGTPPLTFAAIGEPLIEWSIDGNLVSTQACGNETDNMFDKTTAIQGEQYNENGVLVDAESNWYATDYIPVTGGETYIRSINAYGIGSAYNEYDSQKNFIARYTPTYGTPFTVGENTAYITFSINSTNTNLNDYMLNSGTTAKPYEPHGFKLPIVCGGETKFIYIGSNPLRKSLDGTAVDTLSSTGTLTRRVDTDGSVLATPTTESVTVPSIPTVDGSNTFNVNTTVAPSNAYIKYKG